MKRLQRKRTKGWRMLPNSRCVDRSSRWGNLYSVQWWSGSTGYIVVSSLNSYDFWSAPGRGPSLIGKWTKEQATEKAIELYREYATERARRDPEWLDPLRGLDNLYCTCPEGAPCHADVLIELLEQ